MFYVSSTTSTLATTTVCYITSSSGQAACGRRKRRAVLADTMDSADFGMVTGALTKSESANERYHALKFQP